MSKTLSSRKSSTGAVRPLARFAQSPKPVGFRISEDVTSLSRRKTSLYYGSKERPTMGDNLVRLNLSRFTARDVRKIGELGDKMRLLHRWLRCYRLDG